MGKLINEILVYKEEENKLNKVERKKLKNIFSKSCLKQIKNSAKSIITNTIDSINES